MAGAACGIRFDVVGGFAACRGAVVATGTAGRGNPQVIKFGTGKRDGGVAGVASLLGNKVLGGPHYIRRSQPRTADVAGSAVTWRSLEYTPHMAGVTARIGMHALQRKTSFDVIEGLTVGLRKHPRTAQQHKRQKQRLPPRQSRQANPF